MPARRGCTPLATSLATDRTHHQPCLCVTTGTVRVWDVRVQEPVLSMEPASGEAARDCWTVCFGAFGWAAPSPATMLSTHLQSLPNYHQNKQATRTVMRSDVLLLATIMAMSSCLILGMGGVEGGGPLGVQTLSSIGLLCTPTGPTRCDGRRTWATVLLASSLIARTLK